MNFSQINFKQNKSKNLIKLQDQSQQRSQAQQKYLFTYQQKTKQIDHTALQCLNQFYLKLDNFKSQIFSHFNHTIQKLQQKYEQRNALKIYQMNKKLKQYQTKLKIKEQQLQKQSEFKKKFQTLFKQFNILPPSSQQKGQEKKWSPNKDSKLSIESMTIIDASGDKRQQKIIQQKPNNYRSEINPTKLSIEFEGQKWEEWDEQLAQSFKQNTKIKELKVNIVYPNYELSQVSIKPNKTKINYLKLRYIHCVCAKSKFDIFNKFDVNDLKSLNLYNLQDIQCIQLTQKQISDKIFYFISRMNCWKNLKALYIEDNLITDITPLNNFNLSEFVELDISQNPLNENSATFLSQFTFKSLIYFSTSFKQGQNQRSWRILLKNNFKNFPYLQALDIYWSDQLSVAMKKEISNVIQTSNIQSICDINNSYSRKVNVLIKFCQSKKYWNEKYKGREQQRNKELQKIHEQWIQLSEFKSVIPQMMYLQPKDNNLMNIKPQKPRKFNQNYQQSEISEIQIKGRQRNFKTKRVNKQQKNTRKRINRKRKQGKNHQNCQIS